MYLVKNKWLCVFVMLIKKGKVIERFLGIVHVADTTSLSLKEAIIALLNEHSLSLSSVRGQGYDGASNMKGEINGLKTLIMNETPSAYYVHCFAHQLQLTLVVVSKKSKDCGWLFDTLGDLLNVVGVSCKRKDMLREKQAETVVKALEDGEIESGKRLNQELGLGRPGDTRWGSHYKLILNVIALYPVIRVVVDSIGNDARSDDDARKADHVSFAIESFNFIFMIHLMKKIFGIVNELNKALQKKDQDIVNAMSLVSLTKERLQDMRENGWESLIETTTLFCDKNGIPIVDMDDVFVPPGRKKRGRLDTTNYHHFRIEVFLGIIDLQLQEINNRFNEVSMELLNCMSSLSPLNNFSSFDKNKVLKLAEFYPNEFSIVELLSLDDQLDNYIADMRRSNGFCGLKDLGELSMKLVETEKHQVYQQVYLLIKLVLILPVATAGVERAFSSMMIVKNRLRNSMGDQLLNDCLVTFIERDVFIQVSDDAIMKRFQGMQNRRGKM
ncbi:uncharacterized protein [Spinacia oleracea]|uniref:HAT C-terminal dimerisation domain-containing protein n=1 Tax=Spinacia oleracea TaxID=3562 RepID=A0ABM3RHC5_SPIOL|nr:uncharacterized protein LOC130469645 [Spinacia oleracea]